MRDFKFTIVSKISQKYVKPCIELKKYYWVENSGEMGCTKKGGQRGTDLLAIVCTIYFLLAFGSLKCFSGSKFSDCPLLMIYSMA
jgi:hypothetical protein